MTEAEYNRRLKRIRRDNEQKMYRKALRAEQKKLDTPRIETHKLLAIYLFALMNGIVVYSMTAMWVFADFSYLGVLISDIAAQVLIYAIYCIKAYYGKKQSEKMKFNREKLKCSLEDILRAGGESNEHIPTGFNSFDAPSDNYGTEG